MLTRAQVAELKKAPMLDTPNKLALAMKLSEVTQIDVAAATGFTQSYISRIKRGMCPKLPGETERTLAEYFGVQRDDLFPAREEVAL